MLSLSESIKYYFQHLQPSYLEISESCINNYSPKWKRNRKTQNAKSRDFVGGHDPEIPQRREKRYSENILSELVSLSETRPSKLSSKDFEGTFSILTFVGPSTLYCNFERRVSLNDRAFSISGINFFHGVGENF